jgi:hypothetical protein
MRTVKRNPFLSGALTVLGGLCLWAGAAAADVTSDRAAGIVVYPKLVFDSSAGADTVIQLSNTSGDQVNVRCFYVNANSHCSNNPEDVCFTNEDCEDNGLGGICVEGWLEIDFRFTLTAYQPIAWRLSDGMAAFPLDGNRVGVDGVFNIDSAIPNAPEDPFRGELKCVEVDENEAPTDRNDLKGEATIVVSDDGVLDARGYNAIGIQAVEDDERHGDNTLGLGEEYNSCPNILILDHFFDDAVEPVDDALVRTDLTLVPCSQDFELQDAALFNTTVQFLVFNEFEQRFSTSTRVRCFREIPLSDIDTAPRSQDDTDPASTNDERSIFNVNVQGTLTGQTRIRGVDDGSDAHGNGLLGVAEEFHRTGSSLDTIRASGAFNLHQAGVRLTPDVIRLP